MTSNNENTLWMGDLELYMDEKFVFQAFQQMGEVVVKVKLINARNSRNPAGYCFVEFTSADAARRAMLRLNGKIIPGSAPAKRFKLNHATFGRESQSVQEYSLFVGDVSEELDDYNLYTMFVSKYPSCKSANIVLDNNGKTRGYGFVRFTSESEQQAALVEMQGFTGANLKPLRVSMATPKKTSYTSTSTGTPSMPSSYYQQQYYPNYQPFYNAAAAAAWWPAYQQAVSGYYYGQYADGSYAYTGQQMYNYADSTEMTGMEGQTPTADGYTAEDGEEEVEDPAVDVDVSKCNAKFMEQSEELYEAIEKSRWHPVDSVYSTVAPSVS